MSVKSGTTSHQKTKRINRTVWKSKNTAQDAKLIQLIKRKNKAETPFFFGFYFFLKKLALDS
jgi:hypothetical protein